VAKSARLHSFGWRRPIVGRTEFLFRLRSQSTPWRRRESIEQRLAHIVGHGRSGTGNDIPVNIEQQKIGGEGAAEVFQDAAPILLRSAQELGVNRMRRALKSLRGEIVQQRRKLALELQKNHERTNAREHEHVQEEPAEDSGEKREAHFHSAMNM